jgi:hypothetical protein
MACAAVWAGFACLPASGQQYVISTVAGSQLPVTPAPALDVSVAKPAALVSSASGDIYFSALGHALAEDD